LAHPEPPSQYTVDERLAVYGSLAPGERNAHILAPLAGIWLPGQLRGTTREIVRGYAAGYRGITLSEIEAPIACQLFCSHDLPSFWAKLDAFEGAEFVRTVTIVRVGEAVIEAQVYEWRPADDRSDV